jgi:hypothetical protein
MRTNKIINLLFLFYSLIFIFNVNTITVEIQYLISTVIVLFGIYVFSKSELNKYQTILYLLIVLIFLFKLYFNTFKISVFVTFISSIIIFNVLEKVTEFKKNAIIGISVGFYLILIMLVLYLPTGSLNSLDYTRLISDYVIHSFFSDDFRSTDMMPYLTISIFALFLFLKINNKKIYTLLCFLLLLFPVLKFDKSNLWMDYFSFFILTLIPTRYYKYINYFILLFFLLFPILVMKYSVLYEDDYLANLVTSGRIEIWSSASNELNKNFPFNFLFGVGHNFMPFMATPFSDVKTYDEVSYHSGLFRFMAQDGYFVYFLCCIFVFIYLKKLGEYSVYIFLLILLYNLFDGSFFTNFTFYPILIFSFFILKSILNSSVKLHVIKNTYEKISN